MKMSIPHNITNSVLFVVFLPLFLLDCSPGPESSAQKKLETLDSLQKELRTMRSEMEQVDMEKGRRIRDSVRNKMEQIRDNFPDTINKDLWPLLSSYKGVAERIEDVEKRYYSLKKEMKYTRGQLTDLEKDIKAGALGKDKTEKYFSEEKRSYKLLREAYVSFRKKAERSFFVHDSLRNKVDSVLLELKGDRTDP